jgi:Protein of unknown function (DUF3667)
MRELIGDAWHEFSGWDGRFVRTFRALVHPGALTLETLEGRRARYVSPLRLYLVASVAYFLLATAIPSIVAPARATMPGKDAPIDLMGPVSPKQREEALQSLQRAPAFIRVLMQPMVEDPQRVRREFLTTFPRALFTLVPVFAGIVALFYRRRPFSQHVIFAFHLHAALFVVLAGARLAHLTGSPAIAGAIGVATFIVVAVYALIAFRRVYRTSWLWVLVKSPFIVVIYFTALLTAIVGTYVSAVFA